MTIKAHNKTTYTITPVKAGCKESSSWSEEGTHIGNKKKKNKNKNEQNKQAWKTKKDDNNNSSQETMVVNHIKILPCRSLQVSFDHIHIPSVPNTAFKRFFSLLIK